MIQRALISVSDKTGVVDFAKALHSLGVEIISTGGTADVLLKSGIPVTKVADVTGFPEMMDGRVKTLHPRIHGALLALRDNPTHMEDVRRHGIRLIDLVAINLYPFEATISRSDVHLDDAIENIDIGGPSMIRSASKNYKDVIVLVDPSDYGSVVESLQGTGSVPVERRYDLMVKAFEHTAHYDSVISGFFRSRIAGDSGALPTSIHLGLEQVQSLRYGENPHQKASFFSTTRSTVKPYEQLHGKELSYNNILDLDACVRVVSEFDKPCCVIIKHTNPCGAAIDEDLYQAYRLARETDPVSAFGGVIGFNRPVNEKAAHDMAEVFVEAILAPSFDPGALDLLTKKKNIRLIRYDFGAHVAGARRLFEVKKALDGYLVQESDLMNVNSGDPDRWRSVGRRAPSPEETAALQFAWRVVKHVKSNAIVYTDRQRTLGIGAGQMSRVDSAEIAVMKAAKSGLSLKGSVVASDAFFPFRDGVDAAAAAGATAVVQPGGSVKDQEVIDAANEHNMAMIFTSIRHFRH